MTVKLELRSSHEVIDTVAVTDVDSIFCGKPTDPDILTVLMKDGRRLYCDEVCPIGSLQEEPGQEWNRDDEQYLLVCKNALAKYQVTDKWDAGIISRWLENRLRPLRHQNRWWPSDNELEVLRLVAEKDGTCLMGLYEQLKKLKE